MQDPAELFCPNLDCPSRGQVGKANISIHSQKERRYLCNVCQHTFSTTKGTLFYRLRTEPQIVIWVLVLLAHGRPLPAIVAAFELDPRTVREWQKRAGQHCEAVHQHLVGSQPLDLQQVQADEIKVKAQGGSYWMALAMMVATRLWLGGVVSATRDPDLITALVAQVRRLALYRPVLIAVDGLASYVTAFEKAFWIPVRRFAGATGRPRLEVWLHLTLVQVVKQRYGKTLQIERRVVRSMLATVQRLVHASQGTEGIKIPLSLNG